MLPEEQVPGEDTPMMVSPEGKAKKTSSFLHDTLKLVLGTTFSQVLLALSAPFLTRLFTPEDMGTFTLFLSILAISTVVACLRYEYSIMLPKNEDEAANLFVLACLLSLATSLLLALFLWVCGGWLCGLLNAPEMLSQLWWLPPATFFSGLFLALNYWETRYSHYTRLAVRRGINSVVQIVTQVGAGLIGLATAGSLIAGYFLGIAISTLILAVQAWRDHNRVFRRSVHLGSMWTGIKRYRKFLLYDSGSALINSTAQQLPPFLLSIYFTQAVVGFYGLGFRILRLPSMLVGTAIGQVFFQRAARARHDGTLPGLVEETMHRLVVLGMFPLLLLTVAGREIFIVVFGSAWAEAGVYTQILSLWVYFVFISSPLTCLINVLEKQEVGLVFNSILFATRFISLVIGGLQGNPRLALMLFAISGVILYGGLFLWIIIATHAPMKFILLRLGKNFILNLPLLVIIGLAKWEFAASAWVILLLCCAACILYYSVVLFQDKPLREVLFNSLGKYGIGKRTRVR